MEKSNSSITFNSNDIATISHGPDPNKAHGCDMISTHMMKICDKSICKTKTNEFLILHQTRKVLQLMENGKRAFCPQEK